MSEDKSFITPVWRNRTAPCGGAQGCPAHTDIAASLHALAMNDPGRAWKIMMQSHPLRATLGRVCYAFCEKPCNRGKFDSPISIQALEAVIGDNGFDPDWRPDMKKPNGKKILILGSGPGGLTAGYFLQLAGFEVEIFEADDKPGGMMRYGIPSYRLDKSVLDREIGFIEKCGVTIRLNRKVSAKDVTELLNNRNFDAVIVAVGAGTARRAGFKGEDKAVAGLTFLRRVNTGVLGRDEFKKKNVIVIGGGNVAMDACRSAIRLGAESVTTLYRRSEEMMPAHSAEVRHAKEEGVMLIFLVAPYSYDGSVLKGRKMRLGAPDESGRMRPEPTNEIVEYRADTVISAVGQVPAQWDIEDTQNVFICGDVDPESEGTVIHAIASGKKAAERASVFLVGERLFSDLDEEVTYDKMNVDRYFTPGMRLRPRVERPSVRKDSFEPVERMPSLDEGVVEADRCFRCGVCIGGLNSDCDWCFRACGKQGAIVKLMVEWNPEGPLFEKGDNCDVCGACWEDCPRYVVRPTVTEVSE